MSLDPQAIAEARGLMACIRVTRDPAEQNRLWNRYYRLSDEMFAEAAALRQRYKGMDGASRQRFKAEYMELVRRLWLATEPEAAYDQPFSGGPPPEVSRPPRAAAARKPRVHRWAMGAVGLVMLAVGGFVAYDFFRAQPALPWRTSAVERESAADGDEADTAADRLREILSERADSNRKQPTPAVEPRGSVEEEVPAVSSEVPIARIEAELAAEIKPNLFPVPPNLKGCGDRLVTAGRSYSDVYVIASDSSYYVRIPETGAVDSMPKASAELTKSEDTAGREALLDLWRKNKEAIARADKLREEEKARRVSAHRKALEREAERRREALAEASWEAKVKDWRNLAPEQRHSARLRAYSDWRSIQGDAETLEELYRNISRTYEYIGVNDSRMAELNRDYQRAARQRGPNYDLEDAFMIYGWGREEILRKLGEWEEEYYTLLEYVNEHYPVYESRVEEIDRLDDALPEKVRMAEATGSWEESPDGRPRIGISFGTGFIVAKEHVMTCAHVVRGSTTIQVTSIKGTIHKAEIVASDPPNDWCLLKVEGLAGEPIPMATGTPNVGATIYCLGFPLGGIKDSNDPIVGSGNVAALQRIDGDSRFLQITAPINPGNSGGPVLDQQGRWVGIVSQKLNDLQSLQTSQSVAQGLNYAVKATHVSPLVGRSGARVQLTRRGAGGNGVKSLEDITRSISPSIVKIEVE